MNKPFIKSIFIMHSIASSVLIDCGDGTTTNIEVPTENMATLDVDQKFAHLKDRAERYMKCIETNEPAQH